eukprot:10924192-Lingulodinium_polyedra.AAC.1
MELLWRSKQALVQQARVCSAVLSDGHPGRRRRWIPERRMCTSDLKARAELLRRTTLSCLHGLDTS